MRSALISTASAFLFVALTGCANAPARPWGPLGDSVLEVTAEGVQTYRYEIAADGKGSWKFTGPRADLFGAGHKKVGTHYKSDQGPVWEIDGDKIVGTKVKESPRTGAVPELLLSGKCTGTGKVFGTVTNIERLDTEGGMEPTGGTHQNGESIEVKYKARYVFHK
jgi:hypothetical protein